MTAFLRDFLDDPVFYGRLFDPSGMSSMALATGLRMGSTVAGGLDARETGKAAMANARVEAAQQVAAGQRRAFERATQTRKVIGTQIATGGAQGTDIASSPTILDIVSDTAARGKYLEETERAQAQERANATLYAGEVAKRRGANQLTASILDATAIGATGGYRIGRRLPPRAAGTDEEPLTSDILEDEHDLDTNWRTKTTRYR